LRKATFFFLFIILLSCQDQLNDSKHRNQDYIWFVSNESYDGSWVKIDKSRKSPCISDGHCTLFFDNGNVREKYKVDKSCNRDTVLFFNLSGDSTHYSVYHNQEIQNYFFKDGYFEGFTGDGELALTGNVEHNVLVNYSWQGNMRTFYQLIENQSSVWEDSNELFSKTADIIKEFRQSNETLISTAVIRELDSIRIELIDSSQATLVEIEKTKTSAEFGKLKKSTSHFIEENKRILETNFKELFQNMKQEFTEENLSEMRKLSEEILEISFSADKILENEQIEISRSMLLSDFYLPYFKEMKKEK